MALAFVTSNKHKFEEAAEIAKRHGVDIVHRAVPYAEIQADTLEEIVIHGAQEVSASAGGPCFVEDAGLFIDALKGFPGPYSKFVFLTIGNAGVLKLLEGEKNRKAEFRSAVGYCEPGGKPVVFSAKCVGKISAEPQGKGGFGFDPIFLSDGGEGKTFAEMTTELKNKFSHRGKAVEAVVKWYKEEKSLKSGKK